MTGMYRERPDFYPDGYAETPGRRLSEKDSFLSQRCCSVSGGVWWVKTKGGGWQSVKGDKTALRKIDQNWAGGTHRIVQKDIHVFMLRYAPVVRGVMAVPT